VHVTDGRTVAVMQRFMHDIVKLLSSAGIDVVGNGYNNRIIRLGVSLSTDYLYVGYLRKCV